MTITIACTAISKRIQAGRINKEGTAFTGVPVDVTSQCLKAVIEFVGPGRTDIVFVDGVPAFEIEVRQYVPKPEKEQDHVAV